MSKGARRRDGDEIAVGASVVLDEGEVGASVTAGATVTGEVAGAWLWSLVV